MIQSLGLRLNTLSKHSTSFTAEHQNPKGLHLLTLDFCCEMQGFRAALFKLSECREHLNSALNWPCCTNCNIFWHQSLRLQPAPRCVLHSTFPNASPECIPWIFPAKDWEFPAQAQMLGQKFILKEPLQWSIPCFKRNSDHKIIHRINNLWDNQGQDWMGVWGS